MRNAVRVQFGCHCATISPFYIINFSIMLSHSDIRWPDSCHFVPECRYTSAAKQRKKHSTSLAAIASAAMSRTSAFTSLLFTHPRDISKQIMRFSFQSSIWFFINEPTNLWLKLSWVESSWWLDSLKFGRADEFQIEFNNTKVKGLNVQFASTSSHPSKLN